MVAARPPYHWQRLPNTGCSACEREATIKRKGHDKKNTIIGLVFVVCSRTMVCPYPTQSTRRTIGAQNRGVFLAPGFLPSEPSYFCPVNRSASFLQLEDHEHYSLPCCHYRRYHLRIVSVPIGLSPTGSLCTATGAFFAFIIIKEAKVHRELAAVFFCDHCRGPSFGRTQLYVGQNKARRLVSRLR